VKPFFLYVGNRRAYKNFSRLLIAYGQSGLAKEFDLRIISPTNTDFSDEEIAYIERYRLRDSLQLMAAVSEHTLRESYAGAAAFVYPSEYEGFGLPVLEAMASGTIVATSNVASMPEVGGEAAFYFDPCNSESIADCLIKVTSLSREQRAERIALGAVQARTFTWERCQQQTVDVFRTLM
jgi:glycosyltransferase involved in cell wall biosynthesis